jgi:hypothetical protein
MDGFGYLSVLGGCLAVFRAGGRHDGDADSIANEFQCQPGHDKGCEEDRQEPLSGASEGDDLFLGGVEGLWEEPGRGQPERRAPASAVTCSASSRRLSSRVMRATSIAC